MRGKHNTASALGVAIVGAGVVGGGVLRLLRRNAAAIRAHCGRAVTVAAIAVRRPAAAKKRLAREHSELVTGDWREALAHPRADVVVELMGGTGAAADCMRAALKAGKPVVTANKAALAECDILSANGKAPPVFYEAAVAGCVPVVKVLRESLAGDTVAEVFGIINGTCNYILSQMHRERVSFSEALARAQKNGYAEADAGLDIDGADAAHKLALIARLAFGAQPSAKAIAAKGVRDLDAMDIRCAEQLGFVVKLLARAQMRGGELALSVRPELIAREKMLAAVDGAMNAVIIRSENAGETMLYGAGAGAGPTATAVVADIMDIARGCPPPPPPPAKPPKLQKQEKARSEHYLRLRARDKTGVLAAITGLLAKNKISIEAIHQNEPGDGARPTADIVILTHEAARGQVAKCAADIKKLPDVCGDVVMMPVARGGK